MAALSAGSEDPLLVTIEDVKPVVACRGCLATEQPLRLLDDQLADAYAMFISAVEEHDIYPKYICMYCRHLLLRFVSFRKKCLRVQYDLTKIASIGIPITLDLIKSNFPSCHLQMTEPLLCFLGDKNIDIQNIGQSGTSNPIEQNLHKNELNKSQVKEEKEIKVEIIHDILDDEVISLSDASDDDFEDSSDISEDTDLPDCLRGISSDIYKKDTKKNFKDYCRKQNQVKPLIVKQKITKTASASSVDMIIDDIENASSQTVAKTIFPCEKKSQNRFSTGKQHEQVKPKIAKQQITQTASASSVDMIVDDTENASAQSVSKTTFHREKNPKKNVLTGKVGKKKTKGSRFSVQNIKAWIEKVKQVAKTRTIKQNLFIEKLVKQKVDFEKKFNLKIVEIPKDKQIQHIIQRKDTDNYKNARYKCELCFTGFVTKVTYVNHMAVHQPGIGRDSMCDICKRYYPSAKLNYHVRDSHKNDYICNICGHISMERGSAIIHYRWHEGIKYDCKICGKYFDKPTSVLGHMHLSHKDVMVKCTICNHQCIGDKGLNSHMNRSHKEAIGAVCASCGVQFHSVSAMQRHRPQGDCDHTHRPCTACGMGFTSDSLLHDHTSFCEFKKVYKCESCVRCFDDVREYFRHVRGRHGPHYNTNKNRKSRKSPKHMKSFVCETCGKSFNVKVTFEAHRRTHFGEPAYYCDYCGKGFYNKLGLVIHIQTKHMGMARQHKCPYCNKGFDFIGNMKRHVKVIHEKLQPFSCDICNKKFSAKESLQGHVRHTHQGLPWPKRVRNRPRQ